MLRHKSRLFILFIALAMASVAIFQNCGQLNPSRLAVMLEASYEMRFRKDKATVDRLMSSPHLAVWASAQESSKIVTNADGTMSVSSLGSAKFGLQSILGLTPPTVVSSQALKGSVFSFAPGTNLTMLDNDRITSSGHSIIALFEGPLDGRLVSLYSGSSQIEELDIAMSSNIIKAMHYTSQTDAAILARGNVPTGPVVVAVSFGEDVTKIAMQINGSIVTSAIANQGSPVNVMPIERQLILGETNASFRLAEIMVVSEELTPRELNAMSRYMAERWSVPGVIYDPSLGDDSIDEAINPDLLPPTIKPIIMSCATASCHFHASWSTYTVSSFKKDGMIVPKDAFNSKLYYRLIGSKAPQPASVKNMPQGGVISQADVDAIETWINGLN